LLSWGKGTSLARREKASFKLLKLALYYKLI
jgi:hypothetical protein